MSGMNLKSGSTSRIKANVKAKFKTMPFKTASTAKDFPKGKLWQNGFATKVSG